MVLYTPFPLEEVLKNGKEEQEAPYLQIPFSRGVIEVKLTSASTAEVVRLLSNDVNDYLHPKFQPGREIQLTWRQV